jgi:hypothetical protein
MYGLDRIAFEASLNTRGTCTSGLVLRVLRKRTMSNTEEQVLLLVGGVNESDMPSVIGNYCTARSEFGLIEYS